MAKENVYFWPQWLGEVCANKELLHRINQAQVHLWRALNIYDDFFDNNGKAIDLPLANSYLRKFIVAHYKLNFPPDFYHLFNKLMTELEKANRKEIKEQRFIVRDNKLDIPEKLPDFSDLSVLSQKSLALSLGPIAILIYQGYRMTDQKIIATLAFFKYALAAKQLSDDAKDWFEDLRDGNITAVNVLVLKRLKLNNSSLDLNNDIEDILTAFSKIAPQVAQDILCLCSRAKKELHRMKLNKDCRMFKELVGPLEAVAKKSLKFHLLLEKANNAII